MAAQRQYDTLTQALIDQRVPLENHRLIEQLMASVGASGYFETSGYIKAVRSGSGPDLNIASGYTNGFRSEEEARVAAGEYPGDVWPSSRTDLWGVTHPRNGVGHGGGGDGKRVSRDYGTCPGCNLSFSAAGTCGC